MSSASDDVRPDEVRAWLLGFQEQVCAAFEAVDGAARFREERFDGPGDALARPRVLEGGAVFEKAAVHFTDSRGESLPPAATARRPELAGAPFQALSCSLITHPRNPYVPTSHLNLRYFAARPSGRAPVWWFGGGFDLTPYYGFEEDCAAWHAAARRACDGLGGDAYARFKKACDEYFFLRHRGEPRGIGGLFFDDLDEGGFANSFAFVRRVGEAYAGAYPPIVTRRSGRPYGERERAWQLARRGRYVEFNLVYDRGTLYGLQSGRRIESVLSSMPPLVAWSYDLRPEPGSPEAELLERFLVPRDWA
ncbi:MAG TPA: oxygen-dependent coproporphyrinogen oxidase [Myxococcota bacterium]|nr:oxygen-dependent coproporphyrinogen oxidase [Myxococcota bacterium]